MAASLRLRCVQAAPLCRAAVTQPGSALQPPPDLQLRAAAAVQAAGARCRWTALPLPADARLTRMCCAQACLCLAPLAGAVA